MRQARTTVTLREVTQDAVSRLSGPVSSPITWSPRAIPGWVPAGAAGHLPAIEESTNAWPARGPFPNVPPAMPGLVGCVGGAAVNPGCADTVASAAFPTPEPCVGAECGEGDEPPGGHHRPGARVRGHHEGCPTPVHGSRHLQPLLGLQPVPAPAQRARRRAPAGGEGLRAGPPSLPLPAVVPECPASSRAHSSTVLLGRTRRAAW